MQTQDVFIIDAIRTPIGKFAGQLSSLRPDDMAATVIKELISRNPKVPVDEIEDVVWGAANQAGEDNRDVARMAALLAGLPTTVAGVTVNRLCASGMQAIVDATRALQLGQGDIYIAGGSESMSRAPFVLAKAESAYDKSINMFDTSLGWRFTNPKLADMYYPYSMGETAENVADRYKLTREHQDAFAHNSQLKYDQAKLKDIWQDEIVPLNVAAGKKGDTIQITTDEQPRLGSIEILAGLRTAFKKNGTVTAGNAAGLNDGAAGVILANEVAIKRYSLKPMARVVSMGAAGVDPSVMGIGPVPASQKALKRAGLTVNDLHIIELNEAFAAQSLACIQELGLNPDIVNVNGGSIAIGHPLGCSGARITTTMMHEMQRNSNIKYGLATMCIGVGQGLAVVYEKV
ncbi:MAG: acetyl-CoA C-acyltransferase [Bacteroidota bacterium]|nr:acetyl-CoA C-acyltransferase [Bacteroidota bacterium]